MVAFNPNDEVEVNKAGDPNDGRAGKVVSRVPAPFTWPATGAVSTRYDVTFENGSERGEYDARELTKVAPAKKAGA